ncbi:nicotinate-nucleotide-dimethylbenzimidazole phosphoribosyltransferase [Arcticibacter pallidicorallinus]|uniref:Nicotinate-nucleotide--dimethylbenzimidazole phosphoribosyltransferase n=1 Tax=Arcticibacter pallidicorallinus TaxID=1259464 RepID=A0A2T0TQU0_9SPHI|nr:nicotinate-nucleotide-dimethylbenzimidazole phosphoribosyltransferase [Arcticibacter pallidicorallinus]
MSTVTLAQHLQQKIDLKTKPLGALGRLEALALQIGLLQNCSNPELSHPSILTFAADHGIAASGVSAYPAEVTVQMVQNFLQGGAAINVFCRQHGIELHVVDAGVNFEFSPDTPLIDAKAGMGTRNFLHEEAMTAEQLKFCFERSAALVEQQAKKGCNVIGFGEMGIGNTSSASLLMSCLTGLPLTDCVGKGAGVSDEQLVKKLHILERAKVSHPAPAEVSQALRCFGGFEIAQICGGMLKAQQRQMIILVDGFIASVAFLCARSINPEITMNAVFCHQSDELGHKNLLRHLDASPLLHLSMRVGEGTGCAIAYPIIESAVRFLNEMASFESAGVSQKTSE